MNVLADFVKNTLLKQASFDLHQLSAIYLNISEKKITYTLYLLIFHIHFVFVHCAEWGSFAWVPSGGTFFYCAPSLQIFWAILPRLSGDSPFPGDFPAGELGEIFVFCAVVLTIFFAFYLFIYLFVTIIIIVIIIININNII